MLYQIEIRRNNCRETPYVIQKRWYITLKDRAKLKAARLLIADEMEIPKDKRNKDLISSLEKKCLEITQGYDEKYEIFSDGSLYHECIGKYKQISDGWIISKKI
jgi:hypothetical protein